MKHACLLLILFIPLKVFAVECRAVNLEEFRKEPPQGASRVVFFASWCSSCSRFLTADRVSDTIFVAAADEQPKAEKVMKHYLKDRAASARCFFDKDGSIAKAFGIRNLPQVKPLADPVKP